MDFAIPNNTDPQILIEVSYQTTTSSSMGDKAKHEINVNNQIKKHYPNCMFIGFIDGAGWLSRKGDLKRLVGAFDYVFTFHNTQLKEFEKLILEKYGDVQ